MVDDDQLVRGGAPGKRGSSTAQPGGGRAGTAGGKIGNVYAVFEKKDGSPARRVQPDLFPEVRWVSVDNGTREYGDIEDRAAKYLQEQNLLLINSDFRVFIDMASLFIKQLGDQPGIQELVTEAVRGWFEQALVESVIGVQALRNSKEWSVQDIQTALSEEALTATVMQRYHVNLAVKRELGAKLSTKIGTARQKKAG